MYFLESNENLSFTVHATSPLIVLIYLRAGHKLVPTSRVPNTILH